MPDIFIDPNEPEPQSEEKTPPVPQQHQSWIERHKGAVSLLREHAGYPGIFTAFAPKPQGIAFEEQEAGEEILLLLRQHFITNVPWIVLSLFFALLPLFVLPFIQAEVFPVIPVPISEQVILVLTCFYYLVILGFVLNQFATWYYQVGIITNIRVIDVDFNTLLSRNIAYTDLVDIVDTDAHQGGLLQSLFNFGTVGVQTAGMKANFEFTRIPQPNKVVDTISDLMRDRKHHG